MSDDAMTPLSKFSPERIILGVLIFCGLGWFALAKPAGYCKAESRVPAPAEVCEKILGQVIANDLVRLTAGDRTARDFLAREKNACHVDTTAMTRFHRYGLVDAMFSDTIQVSIRYPMTEKAKNLRQAQGSAVWSELLDASPCGEVRDASGVSF